MSVDQLRASIARGKEWLTPLAAVAGVALFAWSIARVGLSTLVEQLHAARPVLPLMVGLAGVRFTCQAAAWRLAIPAGRMPLNEAVRGIVAGEAVGYLAGGPVAREPAKALFVRHRVPEPIGLAAAVTERLSYVLAAVTLSVVACGMLAARSHRSGWLPVGIVAVIGIWLCAKCARRARDAKPSDVSPRSLRGAGGAVHNGLKRRHALLAIAILAALQEVTNVFEAYVGLSWLGAAPTMQLAIMFEGLNRIMNAAGQIVPARLGVAEAASTALADLLHLGSPHGLTLAIARRLRSLLWTSVGIGLIAWRAASGHRRRSVERVVVP
jgi:Lysylphosphatidylglycerol synthase TM region